MIAGEIDLHLNWQSRRSDHSSVHINFMVYTFSVESRENDLRELILSW